MTGISTGNITVGGHAIVGHGNQITVNYQKSQDWQDFLTQREKWRGRVAQYPDDADFRHELAALEQNMAAFKRNVLKLAEDIDSIPVNTERLKAAVRLFNANQYAEARHLLDAEEIAEEQDALLTKQQRLQDEQANIAAQLDDKANEWLLKARLTAIDYSLGEQRIVTTCSYFENALKSGRTAERLFDYAKFLQDNSQFQPAEKLYAESLGLFLSLAENNPAVHLPDVAMTLNNLGILVVADSQRRGEAEQLYVKSLELYRRFAQDNPAVYLPYVATILNNLGLLVAADSQRRGEAEQLFAESLESYRHLAKDNPAVYPPYVATILNNLGLLVAADSQRRGEAEQLFAESVESYRHLANDNPGGYLLYVAGTLNNLGLLVSADSHRRGEAEQLYAESLGFYRSLAKDNPAVYLPSVAATLNNFGTLVSADSQRRGEAEQLYTESLSLRRSLAKDNPAVYLPDVANTLFAFGDAYLLWGEPAQALPLLQESADLLAPLAQQAPGVFGAKYDAVLRLRLVVDSMQDIERVNT